MASNGISTLSSGDGSDATANKEARQIAKLNLAQTRRQAGGDVTQDYYRTLNVYDRIYLPEGYNVSAGSQVWAIEGRPWYATAALVSSPLTLVTGAATSLQIWFDGADITQFQPTNPSDGDGITQWNDKSNFAHNANPIGTGPAARATYETNELNTYSVVRFDGDAGLSINPFASLANSAAQTVFVVAKATNLGTGTQHLTSTNNGGLAMFHDGTEWKVNTSGGTGASGVTGDANWHIFGLVYNGNGVGDT